MTRSILTRYRSSLPAQLACAFLLLLCIPLLPAYAQSADQKNAPAQPSSQDAATKAAERKKHFEEQEKLLENGPAQSTQTQPDKSRASTSDLSISPALVNMLVHRTQAFTVFDSAGHNLTSKAEWSLSNSYVADLAADKTPTITTKDHGVVIVRARVGSETAEASVTVHEGDQLPPGTVLWQAPKPAGGDYKTKQIVVAH